LPDWGYALLGGGVVLGLLDERDLEIIIEFKISR
jgi:hypothetical protein